MVLCLTDNLVVLVPLSGDEDHIARRSQCQCGLYGLTAVGDAEDFLHLFRIKSGFHVIKNHLRVFLSRVVGSEDYAVALAHGFLCHDRALALVAVASASADGDYLSFAVEHFVDCLQHIVDCIRGMGVVNYGCHAFL